MTGTPAPTATTSPTTTATPTATPTSSTSPTTATSPITTSSPTATATPTSSSATTSSSTARPAGGDGAPSLGAVVYRFQGELGPLNPIGLFDVGIRFVNQFEGAIVEGPFAGGRISGPDFFVLRHDGIGEIHAPELIESGEHRIALDVRGYVVPPAGLDLPPLSALLEPGFEFPDVAFRVTGSALAATTSPQFAHLNHTTVVIEGEVNMGTGTLDVTARAVDAPVSI